RADSEGGRGGRCLPGRNRKGGAREGRCDADHRRPRQCRDDDRPGDWRSAYGSYDESGAVYLDRGRCCTIFAQAKRLAARYFADDAWDAWHYRAEGDDRGGFAGTTKIVNRRDAEDAEKVFQITR